MRGALRVQAMQRNISYIAAGVGHRGPGWLGWRVTADTVPQAAAGPTNSRRCPVGAGGALKPCVVCHSVEAGGPLRAAPSLNGIVGAKKARAEWYGYSPALRQAGGTWTEADLDKFLAAPSKFLPGTIKTIVGTQGCQGARGHHRGAEEGVVTPPLPWTRRPRAGAPRSMQASDAHGRRSRRR